ncbi:long-chain-fatty-acid--CoA ligase [Calidifontibacillus erzurumensis]|uniref:Long-chain fatty acid--CoA ligase n=1 Tax=Calidifontibacillus erzurumensis TaxID=2741433 RepID=A0A8J8GAU5_9BACI|nr:long-chain fatty acid--CoA ligase [Calidifontibacillus erzurumensis]NSL50505.1 long-chain fatty acid--CoA ligase [Calidifontibacillus erzurumensis]
MNLASIITEHSISSPNKVALMNEDRLISYLQLEKFINKVANAMVDKGVKPGDRVLLQIGNKFEFVYNFFAAIKCGAIVVPVNPAFTKNEISFIAQDCQPSLYICEETARQNIEVVQNVSKNLLGVYVIDSNQVADHFSHFIQNYSETFEPYKTNADDVCEILYTSGTTGKPKGAMLTHYGLYSNAKTYKEILHCTKEDKSLIYAPLFHSASQTNCMLTMFIAGATNMVIPKFSTEKVLNLLEKEKITFFFGPPSVYAMLLKHPKIYETKLSLRIAFTGAAPVPAEILNRWKEIVGFELLEGYGLTECSPIVCNHKPEDVKKVGSIGPAIPGVQVKIVDEEGNELPFGEKGELIVKGPNVMKGYWNRPEETAKTIKDGWLYTGDIAYQDEDGYFYIVDRKKDMVIRGGLNIYPREIEEVLYRHPNIFEASVIGVPDPIMGEELKAFYSLKDTSKPITKEELSDFCKKYLAPYKIPKYFEQMDELPKTMSGKILKQKLRALSHS